MKYSLRLTLIVGLLVALLLPVLAQDSDDETAGNGIIVLDDVWVTTQDFASFRKGPGKGFDRTRVIDPVVTMEAIGRTADTRWIQVIHDGESGWISSILLVWTGDVTTLPVDGVNPERFIRRAGAIAYTIREAPIYRHQVTPEDQIGTLPAGTEVELTGRLGGSGFFRFQIKYQGQLYWIGSWNVRIESGNYRRLVDTAYLFPYGRLVNQLESNIAQTIGTLDDIERTWQALNNRQSVLCSPIPAYTRRVMADGDVSREPLFQPAVRSLDEAIAGVNRSIALFEDVCNRTGDDFFLTQTEIDTALADLVDARRNLILASSLLEPLRIRNPLLGLTDGQ